MRFAGTRMEGFLSDDRPDYGALAVKGGGMRSAERATGTDLQGKVGATGIGEAGQVEAANIVGAAAAQKAQSEMMGSMFSNLGKIGGAAIGQFGGDLFGGGATYGQVGTSGSDMASFGYTPAQDRAFNSGEGIDYGYL